MRCKYCNRKGFNGKKGLAMHREGHHRDNPCYISWKKEQDDLEKRKSKIKCKICGSLLRNISNTHLRKHGITQQEYKIRFPNAPIFSKGLLALQNELREKTIRKRYTREEIRNLRGEKAVLAKEKKYGKPISEIQRELYYDELAKNSEKVTHKHKIGGQKIKKFYKKLRLNINEWSRHKNRRLKLRTKTNLNKHGVRFVQCLEVTKEKQRNSLIEKYGSLEEAYRQASLKALKTRYKKYGIYARYCPVFSLESQELFCAIEQLMPKSIICYYATSQKGNRLRNEEFQVLVDSNRCLLRFLDFYVPEFKKCIEFDEKHHKYEIQKERDKQRTKEIRESIKGISFLRIKKEKFIKNKEKVIKECMEFLLGT